jgi:hypothetical protein
LCSPIRGAIVRVMPFDFTAAHTTPGQLVPMELNMLPGKPTVHLEYLGPDNATWIAEQVAKANAVVKKPLAIGRSSERPKFTAADITDISELRALLHHAIRKLDAVRTDGKPATAADIPDFIEAIPPDVVRRIHAVADNVENFRNAQFGNPKEIAEK